MHSCSFSCLTRSSQIHLSLLDCPNLSHLTARNLFIHDSNGAGLATFWLRSHSIQFTGFCRKSLCLCTCKISVTCSVVAYFVFIVSRLWRPRKLIWRWNTVTHIDLWWKIVRLLQLNMHRLVVTGKWLFFPHQTTCLFKRIYLPTVVVGKRAFSFFLDRQVLFPRSSFCTAAWTRSRSAAKQHE